MGGGLIPCELVASGLLVRRAVGKSSATSAAASTVSSVPQKTLKEPDFWPVAGSFRAYCARRLNRSPRIAWDERRAGKATEIGRSWISFVAARSNFRRSKFSALYALSGRGRVRMKPLAFALKRRYHTVHDSFFTSTA